MNGGEEFPAESRFDRSENRHYTVQVIRCCQCGKVEGIRKTGDRLKPVSMLADKFRQRGWDVGARRSKDRCPEHSHMPGAKAQAEKDKKRRIEAYAAIAAKGGVTVTSTEAKAAMRDGGVLAMADPVAETAEIVMDIAAEKLAGIGRVTRVETPPTPPVEPKPEPLSERMAIDRQRRRLVVDAAQHNPEPGTTYFIHRGSGHPLRQTGWFMGSRKGGASRSNLVKSARSFLGKDAAEDTDFALFTEPDGTMGWKPLPAVPTPYTPEPAPSPETPMPAEPTQGTASAAHDWTDPKYNAQRRQVLDGLDNHYIGVERYKADWSDAKLAEHLNVPRGLVTNVREQFFGPDVNEAGQQVVRDLKAVRDDANRLAQRHLELAADAEALAGRCNAALAKAGAL